MHSNYGFASEYGLRNYLQAAAYSGSISRGLSPAPTQATGTFTIAISRQAGIDAGAYARAIGQLLGWPVWDHELLELVASRLGANVHDLESLDERHISWIQESLEAFLLMHSVNQHTFLRRLREAMEDLAALGNCIIVGRGAPHILPARTTLKLRLVAPHEQRLAAFRQQMGIADARHAERELEKIDRERTRFVSEHFHKDGADPAAYDLVLNTAHLSEAECALLVLDGLHAFEHAYVPSRAISVAVA